MKTNFVELSRAEERMQTTLGTPHGILPPCFAAFLAICSSPLGDMLAREWLLCRSAVKPAGAVHRSNAPRMYKRTRTKVAVVILMNHRAWILALDRARIPNTVYVN